MRLVPDVPFVQRQHDSLGRTALRRHRIADRRDFLDEGIQIFDDGEVFLDVVGVIAEVRVQRNEVHFVEALIQDLVLP
jgi:hypothetical protein